MILQALYQLAMDEGLMEDPDYEPRPIAYLIKLSEDGKYLGVQSTHSMSEGKKPKRVAKTYFVPRCGGRTSGSKAFFLFDNLKYVLGYNTSKDKEVAADVLSSQLGLFRDEVRKCFEKTRDVGARAVFSFLGNDEQIGKAKEWAKGNADLKNGEMFSFIVGEDASPVFLRDKVRAYFKETRLASVPSGSKCRCLVTGKECSPGALFPMQKGVPGGNPTGTSLVSVNCGCAKSYGWESNENAPISQEAAETASTALNRLLSPSYPKPDGTRLAKQNFAISSDTAVCYWAKNKDVSFFSGLLEANPEKVGEIYRSIWKGKWNQEMDDSPFYAVILSGNSGRVIVRGWLESTIKETLGNLALYFSDLNIVRNCPSPRAGHLPHFPIMVLAESLAPRGDKDKIPHDLVKELVDSALLGRRLPISILQKALERTRSEAGKNDWDSKNMKDARMALVKAVLSRRKRLLGDTVNYKEITVEMNASETNQGYILGKLLAVLEKIQHEAMGEVNASVIDRFYSGARSCPKAVYPRLMSNAHHHVRKAKGEGKFIFRLERLMDELIGRLGSKTGFPSFLALEEQGLFDIGYHHMRAWLWMAKERREEWEKANQGAPSEYLWGKTELGVK